VEGKFISGKKRVEVFKSKVSLAVGENKNDTSQRGGASGAWGRKNGERENQPI